ncbi:MAG: hypothetical protein V2A73_17025 [Pseudomonadota bacterium]
MRATPVVLVIASFACGELQDSTRTESLDTMNGVPHEPGTDPNAAGLCIPFCSAIGSRSEGWHDSCTGELICWANCAGETAKCGGVGTRSEGYYAEKEHGCGGESLVRFQECKAIEVVEVAKDKCLDLPLAECEARGCQVALAYPYDAAAGCYLNSPKPAFCKAEQDIECFWAGDPIVMTDPDGNSWYSDSSCFLTPTTWKTEYFSEGKPECEDDEEVPPADETCVPVCKLIGSFSEGWYDSCTGKLICWANCAGETAQCDGVGTRSEGYYTEKEHGCDGEESLIRYQSCAPR